MEPKPSLNYYDCLRLHTECRTERNQNKTHHIKLVNFSFRVDRTRDSFPPATLLTLLILFNAQYYGAGFGMILPSRPVNLSLLLLLDETFPLGDQFVRRRCLLWVEIAQLGQRHCRSHASTASGAHTRRAVFK